jgi:hypothetical protein
MKLFVKTVYMLGNISVNYPKLAQFKVPSLSKYQNTPKMFQNR